jgi:hypothetical protein
MDRSWEGLGKSLTDKMMGQVTTFIQEDAWNLITDEGKAQIAECAALYVEAGMVEAAGGDATVAKAAIAAAIGNWELSGKIRMAGHTDDFLAELKDVLVKAAGIALTLIVAAI